MDNKLEEKFSAIAAAVTTWLGKPIASIIAAVLVVGWSVGGFIFGFSEAYQMVANTFTTLVTFLMVFIIQNSQNKDTTMLHLKLNELIAANEATDNKLLAADKLSQQELKEIKVTFEEKADEGCAAEK